MIAIAAAMAATALAGADEWESRMEQGRILERSGQYASAAECYANAVAIPDLELRQRMHAWNAVARMRAELGAYPDAVRAYERALDAAEGVDRGVVLGSLATLHIEYGQKAKGERLLREAVTMLERLVPLSDVRLARLYNDLGELLVEQRNYAEAEPLLRRAAPVFAANPDEGRLGIVSNNIGLLRMGQRRFGEAAAMFEEAIAAFGPDAPPAARVWNNLGTAYAEIGRTRAAESAFQNALRVAELRFGPAHPTYAALLRNYASFARKNGRKAEAKALTEKSEAILREHSLRAGRYATVDVSAFQSSR